MADPATQLGAWPRWRGPILDWLIGSARRLPTGLALLGELCGRLVETGLPLARASFHVRTLHPQMYAAGFYWQRGSDEVQMFRAPHGVVDSDTFRLSPMRLLFEDRQSQVRQRLDLPEQDLPFPLYAELKAAGLTEYVALPLTFGDGKLHGTTWSTDRPGGFTEAELDRIRDLLPLVGLLLERLLLRHTAIHLLDTYVGRHAGQRILEGQITRGSGETVQAAIWFSDLRGFTAMSERQERDELLDRLNQYFDRMAAAVQGHGGEILKFIGDAMLAIFPLADDEACARALQAAIDARKAMALLNRERMARGEEALRYGIALHVGEVMFGNIGAADRLDFTVIGPAVNQTSRIEGLCRRLGLDLLISDCFVELCGGAPLVSVGRHELTGVARTLELFTLAASAAADPA